MDRLPNRRETRCPDSEQIVKFAIGPNVFEANPDLYPLIGHHVKSCRTCQVKVTALHIAFDLSFGSPSQQRSEANEPPVGSN